MQTFIQYKSSDGTSLVPSVTSAPLSWEVLEIKKLLACFLILSHPTHFRPPFFTYPPPFLTLPSPPPFPPPFLQNFSCSSQNSNFAELIILFSSLIYTFLCLPSPANPAGFYLCFLPGF